MKYRKLGGTNENLSVICLGTMTWGQQNTESDAHEQMSYAITQGINFFDTAEMYAVPPSPQTQGLTETYIGNWFKKTGKRSEIFLASKVVSRRDSLEYIREGKHMPIPDKKNLKYAIEQSLRRLQTDHVDLYQIHWPDRKTNFFGVRGYTQDKPEDATPILETLEAATELMREGKIRYLGISNETPWGVMQYLALAQKFNLPKIVSIQNAYSLIMREFEIGLAEISMRENVGLLAYSPLGAGVLSGKYLYGTKPSGARHTLYERTAGRYNHPYAQPAIKAYVDLAKKHGLDPSQMALAFVNSRPFVTSTIIGATKMDQLKSDIASINLELSEDILTAIASIHSQYPNPCS